MGASGALWALSPSGAAARRLAGNAKGLPTFGQRRRCAKIGGVLPTQLNGRIEELLPIGGNAPTEARKRAPPRRIDKITDRMKIKPGNVPAFSQRAPIDIAVHIALTMFAMAPMLGRHTAQLKMPRPAAC